MYQYIIFVLFSVITIGNIIVISTSKIRKITAIRKNWIENGVRGDLFGSNPHSNGLIFSRSIILFLAKIEHAPINPIEIVVDSNKIVIKVEITFSY
jgi:hypothetical protein